jgi:transcriptional antiterminator Rof (Rho-off)
MELKDVQEVAMQFVSIIWKLKPGDVVKTKGVNRLVKSLTREGEYVLVRYEEGSELFDYDHEILTYRKKA